MILDGTCPPYGPGKEDDQVTDSHDMTSTHGSTVYLKRMKPVLKLLPVPKWAASLGCSCTNDRMQLQASMARLLTSTPKMKKLC
jgi:hypothetical protein